MGRRDVCALAIDASMTCWGRWYDRAAPLGGSVVAPDGRFLAFDAADTQVCGVRTDGTFACWGAWQASGVPAASVLGRGVHRGGGRP
ncbi:MAG: hypothetical protein R3C32_08930 [Chloroflexota bacterium]